MWRWRKIVYSVLLIIFVLDVVLALIIRSSFFSQKFQIIFFNIGQGDAILVQQGKNQVLIDGGRSEKKLLEKLGKYVPFWDREIEVIEATHPDSDHITGLIGALKNYKVDYILKTRNQSQTKTFQAFQQAIKEEVRNGGKILEASQGLKIKFPQGGEAKIIYPFNPLQNNSFNKNENSIVTQILYKKNSFLLMGDLPSQQERELIKHHLSLQSQVLKIGHHGSRSSSCNEFLTYVHPQVAIISVGKNSYGHPHKEVLKRLVQHQIKFWRTDKVGDIEYLCNKDECHLVLSQEK